MSDFIFVPIFFFLKTNIYWNKLHICTYLLNICLICEGQDHIHLAQYCLSSLNTELKVSSGEFVVTQRSWGSPSSSNDCIAIVELLQLIHWNCSLVPGCPPRYFWGSLRKAYMFPIYVLRVFLWALAPKFSVGHLLLPQP